MDHLEPVPLIIALESLACACFMSWGAWKHDLVLPLCLCGGLCILNLASAALSALLLHWVGEGELQSLAETVKR